MRFRRLTPEAADGLLRDAVPVREFTLGLIDERWIPLVTLDASGRPDLADLHRVYTWEGPPELGVQIACG